MEVNTMAKVMMTPSEFQEKQARRLKGSIEDIRSGIQRVTESPTAKAAKKADKMVANLTAAVNSGKWASRLNSVTLEDWKQKAIDKGLSRIASGIDGAKAKVEAFAAQLLPFEANLQESINKLPDLTLEDSVNRATSWIRGMSKFQRK
jgi:hypothetical protein